MKGSAQDPNAAPFLDPGDGFHSTRIGGSYGYGLIGGRLGYAHDRSLFYVKSGAVFTSIQTNYDDFNVNPAPSGVDGTLHTSGKSNNVGYAIGGGIEQALPPEWFKLAKNISIKAEYLYLGIERTQTSSGIAQNLTGPYEGQTFTSTNHISGIHTAKIGINYRFRGL